MTGNHLSYDDRDIISVIIPVFNAGDWLQEALESVRSQTYPHLEVIMVNDGSTDNSESICRNFQSEDSRFRLITQENRGVSAARNLGMDLATGRWTAFMDADDILPADSMQTLINLQSESGAEIVAGRYVRGIPEVTPPAARWHATISSDEAIILGLYQKRILNSPCGILFKSSVLKGEPVLRFRNCRYEDLDFFYRAFERVDRITVSDQIVYYYRDTPGSFINSWSDARFDVLDVTDRIVEHLKGKDEKLLRAAEDRRFSAHFNILVEMMRNGVDNPAQEQRCWSIIKRRRLAELLNPHIRIKNKLGALASYLGKPAIRLLCKY